MTGRHDLVLTRADGSEETVCASEDETVLEAAEAHGVSLPFGCRTGACGSCAGNLVAGTISYDRSPRALTDRHGRSGYVLCCIARPQSDCVIAVGSRVLAELVARPWE